MASAVPIIAGAIATSYLGTIGGALVAFAVAKVLAPKPADFEDRSRGISQNITSTSEPIPVIYGKNIIAGSRVFAEVTGSDNEFLHMVIAFAEGEIDAFEMIYFDELEYTNARFSGLYSFGDGINAHLGTDTQAADSALVAATSKWTSAHQGKGVAYLYVRLKYDTEAFPRVPVISARVRGKKVVDVVAGGAPVYSNNPANCIYDYLTNTRYGRGVTADEIDLASFQVAHAACAASVTGNAPEPTHATYECDGVLNPDNNPIENLRDLLTSCRGYLIYTGGKYRLLVDGVATSSAVYDASNMVGGVNIKLDGASGRVNRVRARYFWENSKYKPQFHVEDDATYRTEDNGTLLERQIELPFTVNYYRAKRIAREELEQARRNITVQFQTKLIGLQSEVGDIISITRPEQGWVNKQFRIVEMRFNTRSTIQIVAREYSSDVYTPVTPATETVVPALELPPVPNLEDSIVVEPDTFWSYTFEDGTTNWVDEDGTIVSDADAFAGAAAGLVTHGGGGETASVSIPIGAAVAANFQEGIAHQLRVQMYAKTPGSNAATGFKARIVGSSESTSWQQFNISGTYASYGFNWRPSTPQSSVTLEIIADDSDTGTAATLIDNVSAYVMPRLIDTATIDQFFGSLAIGSAYLADASIQTAKIADAAVTTAKINDLQVTTLKIANNAVTVPGGAYTSSGTTLSGSYKNMAAASIDSEGQPVIIVCSCRLVFTGNTNTERQCTGRVLRGGAAITGGITISVGGLNRNPAGEVVLAFTTIDNTGTTGTQAYTFQVVGGGDVEAYNRGIAVIGSKK